MQELLLTDAQPSSSTVIDNDGDAFNVGGLDSGDWEVPPIGCGDAYDGALYIQVGPAAMHRGNQGQ